MQESPEHDPLIARIVRAYDEPIVVAYCAARFVILRQRFLTEIGRHIPDEGSVLDVGCGFGLFALYFAATRPHVIIRGFDVSERRIAMAKRASARLGIRNVSFEVADARTFRVDREVSAAYMLDLIHHIDPASAAALVRSIAASLEPGGRLLIKDIEPAPAYKLAFTWLLDKMMNPRAPVRYWASREVEELLASLGFAVERRRLPDFLPYPHILYVGSKREDTVSNVS